MKDTGTEKDKLPDLVVALENHKKKVQEMTTGIEAVTEINKRRIMMREERLQQLKDVEANISKIKDKMKTLRNRKVELKI